MSEEFRARLVTHAQVVRDRASRATTEAATQQYLILPFFQLLGYDPLNPDEIVPEAHAAFSDKFKNRVDYAICQNKDPVIAVECKCAGKLVEANRGELKGYFNALASVKLGILTDGIAYELYSDTGAENMMDDEPFVRVDLSEVAEERITDNALDALLKLRKGTFDPADVGADAKRKIYVASYVEALEQNFRDPNIALVKVLMDLASVEGRKTGRHVEEHAPIVRESIRIFFDKKILERVGFAERQDLVRMPPAASAPVASALPSEPAVEEAGPPTTDSGIVTTDTELFVFSYVRARLAFLVKDEALFNALDHIRHVDRKTIFTVFYKQERKGRLFNFREGDEPKYRFDFPDLQEEIVTDHLGAIDAPLLAIFRRRVEEMG